MAEWWEQLLGMTPNAVGAARADIEPSVAPYRAANGSLDPNALRNLVPEGARDEADLQIKMGQMRNQALDSYKPKPLSWNQFLGGALQEISVPVAYAQGNSGYAQQMMPNTGLKKYQARVNGYEDDANAARLKSADETITGVGDTSLAYMKQRREKLESARDMVAKKIAAAGYEGGPAAQREAAKPLASYLRTLGMTDYADALEKQYGGPAVPSSPNASVTQGSASTPSASVGAPSAMPSVSTSNVGAPPATAASLTSSQQSLVSPKRRLAAQIKDLDPARYDVLMKEADLEEAGPKAAAIKSAETLAEGSANRENKVLMANENSVKVGQMLDRLAGYGDVDGVENYTGAIEGSSFAPYTTDLIAGFRRGNDATPGLRDQIRGTQSALVSILKPFLRTPGEGANSDRDVQIIMDAVGDLTNANTIDDYWSKLSDTKERIEALTGAKIPTQSERFLTKEDEEVEVPNRISEKIPPIDVGTLAIGEVRKTRDGSWARKIGPGKWIGVEAPTEPTQDQAAMDKARANLARRGR